MTTTVAHALVPEDLAHLFAAVDLIRTNNTGSVLATAMPLMSVTEREALAAHTYFAHAAVLVFPSTLDGLALELARHGIDAGMMTPSVVVRNRLSRRYGVPVENLDVGILRAPVMDSAGRPCELEIFAMATPPDLAHVAAEERLHSRERHFALAVPNADPIILNGLRSAVATQMRPDGGGYNEHENHTVLYFRDTHQARPEFRRLELISVGEHPQVLATHLRETAAGTQLLRLLTGAWATQAIATAAELRLADHLATTGDLRGLAVATGADQDSLGRLLRYLTALGLVRTTPTGHALTDMGALLRSDVDGSMRPLALLYGGPFYQSFAALTDAVRTGEESYAKVFGANHFAHMATELDLADLFHQSMAASNAVFAELTRVVESPVPSWTSPAATAPCCPGSSPPTRLSGVCCWNVRTPWQWPRRTWPRWPTAAP